jgi:hypothetical protein
MYHVAAAARRTLAAACPRGPRFGVSVSAARLSSPASPPIAGEVGIDTVEVLAGVRAGTLQLAPGAAHLIDVREDHEFAEVS